MPLNEKQIRQLLAPINPKRVLKDGKGNAHLAANDVIAHLNRLFGFTGWHKEVLSCECIFEMPNAKNNGRWDVCYKAQVRLTIKDPDGEVVAIYEDGSTGSAQNQTRGDGHDLAMKSAISLALKRAAKDLGDQLGLSLYSKGQLTAIVKATLVGLPDEEAKEDVQADVEQVVSMGIDEVDRDEDEAREVALATLRSVCAKDGLDMNAVALAFDGDLKTAKPEDIAAYTILIQQGAVQL
jgi:hypothetical protein